MGFKNHLHHSEFSSYERDITLEILLHLGPIQFKEAYLSLTLGSFLIPSNFSLMGHTVPWSISLDQSCQKVCHRKEIAKAAGLLVPLANFSKWRWKPELRKTAFILQFLFSPVTGF